ncbi:TPA: hypothetical protein DCY43_01065 [candidate division WWE3 bacterium]|uniref:DUF6922 domain-containing protein n=1 Tax=candidate division WWE3 bacterium TaxID=2053526 RepID=A0A351JSR2_UNCKA|nr:hypothetical protein [candidate division WWE3 bacterium]
MQHGLPVDFKKYFWDVRFNTLTAYSHPTFIIERLLEFGDVKELDWLNSMYTKDQITNVLLTSRRLSPKTGNFFAHYYNVPKESLVCMKKLYI